MALVDQPGQLIEHKSSNQLFRHMLHGLGHSGTRVGCEYVSKCRSHLISVAGKAVKCELGACIDACIRARWAQKALMCAHQVSPLSVPCALIVHNLSLRCATSLSRLCFYL